MIIPPKAAICHNINCCLCGAPFVGRGHDPADQVAHFALAQFNESAFVSLRFGGVMTPPYESKLFGVTNYCPVVKCKSPVEYRREIFCEIACFFLQFSCGCCII